MQQRQDFPGAAAHYHAYVTIKGEAPAEIWSNLAVCQHKLGALRDAEASYRKALLLAPGNFTAEFSLVGVLVELGQCEEAIRRLSALRETVAVGTRRSRAAVRAADDLRLDGLVGERR